MIGYLYYAETYKLMYVDPQSPCPRRLTYNLEIAKSLPTPLF